MFLKRWSWIYMCVLVQQFLLLYCDNITSVENVGTTIYENDLENEILETAKALDAQPQFNSFTPHSSEGGAELNSVHSDLKCDQGKKCEQQSSSPSAYEIHTNSQTQTLGSGKLNVSDTQTHTLNTMQTFDEHTTVSNVDLVSVTADKDIDVSSQQAQTLNPSIIPKMHENYETMYTERPEDVHETPTHTTSNSHETQTMLSNTYYSHTHSSNNMAPRNITWFPLKIPENSSSQNTTRDETDGKTSYFNDANNMSSTLGNLSTVTEFSIISTTLLGITDEENAATNHIGNLNSVETTNSSAEMTHVSTEFENKSSDLVNSNTEETSVMTTETPPLHENDMTMQYLSPIEQNTSRVRDLTVISTTLTTLDNIDETVSSDAPETPSIQTTRGISSMLTSTEDKPPTTSDNSEMSVHNSSSETDMSTKFIEESEVSTEPATHDYKEILVSHSSTITEATYTNGEIKDPMIFLKSTMESSTLNDAEAVSSTHLSSVQEEQESTTVYPHTTDLMGNTTPEPVHPQSSNVPLFFPSEILDTAHVTNATLSSTTEVTMNNQVITEKSESVDIVSTTSPEVTSTTLNSDGPSTMPLPNIQDSGTLNVSTEHPQTSEEKESVLTHSTRITMSNEADLETTTYSTAIGSKSQDLSTVADTSNQTVNHFTAIYSKSINDDNTIVSNLNDTIFAHHTTITGYESIATESSHTSISHTAPKTENITRTNMGRYVESEMTSIPKSSKSGSGHSSQFSTIFSEPVTTSYGENFTSAELGPKVFPGDDDNTVTTQNLNTSLIHRGGKNIFFNESSIYFSESTHPTFTTDVSSYSVSTFEEHETPMKKKFLSQINAEDLTRKEEANVITAIIQLSETNYSQEILDEKTLSFHLWLVHTIMEGSRNRSVNISENAYPETDEIVYENFPSVMYILPTPMFNAPNLTFSFVAHNFWSNKTLLAESLIKILKIYSYQLHSELNTSNTFFLKGFLSDVNKPDWLEAMMGRNGVIILTTCLITVGIIVLLVLAVVHYRIKHRQSVHCITDVDKLHRNIQEAVGIDLNPAIIILQDEMNEKTILSNGDKTCAVDDDEGWLVPITDVPLAEDTNAASVQDTKL